MSQPVFVDMPPQKLRIGLCQNCVTYPRKPWINTINKLRAVLNSVAQNEYRIRYVLLFQSFADAGVSMRARIVSDPLMSLDRLR